MSSLVFPLVPLSQIQDVLGGRQTDSFRAHQGTPEEGCCFSIVYIDGGHTKTLDLIAPNLPIAFLWISGLQALTRQGKCYNKTSHFTYIVDTLLHLFFNWHF